jgi:DNA-binding MarR family transcriptional regulator
VQGFVRQFGLLVEDHTPCGVAIPLSQAHALLVLRERGGAPMRQKDLASALGLDKSSVARLCARLSEQGRVVQQRSEADGRARDVALTAKGRKLADRLEEASRSRFDCLLAAIPSRHRTAVVQALVTLHEAATTLGERKLTDV